MTRRLTTALTLALAASLVLAAGAAAHDATIAPGGEISMVSSGKVTFAAGTTRIECNLTLPGSFSRSITNLEAPAEQEAARVGSLSWRECVGAEIAAVLGTPWTFVYTGETGSMPNEVSSMQMTLRAFQYELGIFGGFIDCLYRGDLPFTMAMTRTRVAGVYTTGAMRTTEGPLSLVSGGGCPERQTLTGTFSMSPTQTITIS